MVLLSDKAAATPSPRATQSSFAPASASGTRQDAQPIGLDGTIPARGMPTLKLAALHWPCAPISRMALAQPAARGEPALV